jgi:hypothetical protein
MVGAAMFLPGQAFAEKNEHSGQQNSQKASVPAVTSVKTDNTATHANVPAQAENAKSPKKTVVVPKPSVVNKGVVKQQASNNTPPRKGVTASPNLPVQAKSNAQSAIKKTEKAVWDPGSEKVTVENKSGLGKNQPTFKKTVGNSLDNRDTEVKNTQSKKLTNKIEPKGEGTHLSSKRENGFKPLVPTQQKKGKVPTTKQGIPDVNQMNSPTERTNSSGGKPNDRVSQGSTTISQIDKWFEWTKNVGRKLAQPYLSRQALMNNQWVNAPPSPPPQEAPLLKTVTRS